MWRLARVMRVVVLGLGMLACASAPALSERRVALVIGNSGYEHAPVLRNPRHDAEAIAAAFKELGFDVIAGFDLGRAALEGTVQEFARALDGAAAAVVYYSGHGLQVAGKNYIVPIDARLRSEADLPFETIARPVNAPKSRSCRSSTHYR